MTKAGPWLHEAEFAARRGGGSGGVLGVLCNPGHLRSDLYWSGGRVFRAVLDALVQYPAVYGAYTELFCGLSPEIPGGNVGRWGELVSRLVMLVVLV